MSIGPLGDINNLINLKQMGSLKDVNNLMNSQDFGKIASNPQSLQNYLNDAFSNNIKGFEEDSELQNDLKKITGNTQFLQGGVSVSDTRGNIAIDGINNGNALTPAKAADSFSSLLNTHLNSTTQKQKEANELVERFAVGDNVDLHTVMIASEKASTAMQFTMQLRNKMLQAYQEISRMQI